MVEPTAEKVASTPGPDPEHPLRLTGRSLLVRLVLYHSGLAIALALLLLLSPLSLDQLPVGGLPGVTERASVDLSGVSATGREPAEMQAVPSGTFGLAPRLVMILVGLWLLMLPVSWLHRGIYRTSNYDHSIDETTLILPGVVAAIVVVVQHSLALAFALAGIAATVRFRRALQDTFDAQFILVAIGAGIAAGVGALEVALVLSVFFCYATLFLCSFGDGLHSDFKGRQKKARAAAAAERTQSHEPPAGKS